MDEDGKADGGAAPREMDGDVEMEDDMETGRAAAPAEDKMEEDGKAEEEKAEEEAEEEDKGGAASAGVFTGSSIGKVRRATSRVSTL